MAQQTESYNRSMAGSIGAGMKSLFGGKGRRYYILEHKVGSKYHKLGENQRIIVDEIELGRDSRCQVRYDENFATVSRRHAAIVKDGDNWKLVQLSTTNSTFLNGRKIEHDWYLQNGDEIQLSVNGPKLGFILPQGDTGLVKSIGLTARMNLFRQQALRPYKQAILALAAVLLLCAGVGTYVIIDQSRTIKDLTGEYHASKIKFEADLKQANEQRMADSIHNAEELEKQKKQFEKEIAYERRRTQKALDEALAAAGGMGSGLAAMLEQQQIYRDIYFMYVSKVVYIIDGQEYVITSGNQNYGWCGTGFLLDDGRFVTARHCVEGWWYSDWASDEMIAQAARAAATSPAIKLKAYITAKSTISNTEFNFTSDDFRIDNSRDRKEQIGTDDNGNPIYWNFTFPVGENWSEAMWSTDWAYTTRTGGHKGKISADTYLSQSLLPMQQLVVLGFPRTLGVNDGMNSSSIEPISAELTASRRGLAGNGCILHSRGTDKGNSGGPIFAIKDGRLVVVGIVSRLDNKTSEHSWAVPICNIN